MHRKRLYRRSRSDSSSESPLRAWRRQAARLWQRIPEGVPETVAFGVVFAIGLLMVRYAGRQNPMPGIAVLALACAGLGWQGWRWRERALEERRRREKLAMKSERRRIRRQREADELEEKRLRAAKDAAAHQRARALQDERRFAEIERAAALEKIRRGRDEAIELEASRLISLSEPSLVRAAEEAFAARGYIVAPVGDEANCDFILNSNDGGLLAVARLVPRTRKADGSDVLALDAWRVNIGAGAGYLIGLAGFTPAAVRTASSTPITLAEAHILAQWLFDNSDADEMDSLRPDVQRSSSPELGAQGRSIGAARGD